ncbi:Lsr2 family protein [Kribbella albertanoniae]|uniref:Lsr2 family protein n=1 Tax=Kribbella albertanoniae TaxID=1266829 RepID=A0A4R4QJ63_9ACTN|nr:Lsr2 family protein [Kribbella albertanoniae]TDC35758.1 Lsr2 family protein [Kribbella albertanoniae]
MAQRVEVHLTDDTDGTNIPTGKGETLTFALDGQLYEIDLTNKNAEALRKALSPYVGAGRRVTTSRGAKVKHTKVGPDAKTVKEWARANGYEVNDRGRIPDDIRAAFDAAN